MVSDRKEFKLNFNKHELDDPTIAHAKFTTGLLEIPGSRFTSYDLPFFDNNVHRRLRCIKMLQDASAILDLSFPVISRAAYIAHKIMRNSHGFDLPSIYNVTAAALYMSLRENDSFITMNDLINTFMIFKHETTVANVGIVIARFSKFVNYSRTRLQGIDPYIKVLKNSVEFKVAYNKNYGDLPFNQFIKNVINMANKIKHEKLDQHERGKKKRDHLTCGYYHLACLAIKALEREMIQKNRKCGVATQTVFTTKFLDSLFKYGEIDGTVKRE
jgi:hypothetical protein